MNFEKIAKYADLIERNAIGLKFDMSKWVDANDPLSDAIFQSIEKVVPMVEEHKCGTAACIAGHIAVIALQGFPTYSRDAREIASRELELTYTEASILFTPLPTESFCSEDVTMPLYSEITREQAVAALRNIVENKTIVGCWPARWNVNYFRYDEEEST